MIIDSGSEKYQLIINNCQEFFAKLNLPAKDTVCLIYTDINIISNDMLLNIIKSGCIFFILIGRASAKIHDTIDRILEENDIFHVVTTEHTDEDVEDIAWFFLNATVPYSESIRYILYIEPNNAVGEQLIEVIVQEYMKKVSA